jgi:hypothetical protein
MSVRKGNKIVSGRGKNGTGFALFTPKFFDYILNNPSWLRADTFSWHSGELYKSAYEHLYNDFTNLPSSTVTYYAWSVQGSSSRFSVLYTLSETPSSGDDVYVEKTSGIVYGGPVNSISGTTIEAGLDADGGIVVTAIRDSSLDETKESSPTYLTETIGSTTINYYRTSDGHKIVMPDQESNVEFIYQEVGVAWYYILDTTNKLFKLPRTKYSFTGLRDSVGNFVEAGLPNITGQTNFAPNAGMRNDAQPRGAFYKATATGHIMQFEQAAGNDLGFDASLSSEVYGKSDTVQPNSTQMYLYFYVGNTVINQTEVDVGILTEQLNGKQDVLGNNVDYVVESYNDGTNWYRVYKSGWVEQGGKVTSQSALLSVSLLKPYANTLYSVIASVGSTTGNLSQTPAEAWPLTASAIQIAQYGGSATYTLYWEAKGKGA